MFKCTCNQWRHKWGRLDKKKSEFISKPWLLSIVCIDGYGKKIEREMSSQGKERKEWNLKTDGR